MSSFNQVIIVGNLGRDPEMRYLPNGQPATEFSVATSRSWKDKQTDEWKEQTEWHTVKMYGNSAERAAERLRKGSKVLVTGRIETRSWDDAQAGHKHYKTEIIADKFVPLEKGADAGEVVAGAVSGFAEETASFGGGYDAGAEGSFKAPAGGFASSQSPRAATRNDDDFDNLPF